MSVTISSPIRALTCVLALLWSGVAQAQSTVVVELFTSQGCSSCPPADQVLADLRDVPGIVPLTLNVDYWDYLGWKDDLALPGNALRQRAYARKQRSRNVYTPQMMFDGKMDVVGSRKRQVQSAVNAYSGEEDAVAVSLAPTGDGRYRVQAPATAGLSADTVIWVVGYDRDVTKAIGGGENHGRTITYANVVREWRAAGKWDGKSPLDLAFTAPTGDGGAVVIVQQGNVGPILGAAQARY